MKKPSIGAIGLALPLLSRERLRVFTLTVLRLSYDDAVSSTPLCLLDQALLGLCEWLVHLGFGDGPIQLVLQQAQPQLAPYCLELEIRFGSRSQPTFSFCLSAGRYASWPGIEGEGGEGFYDIRDCCWVMEMPRPATTHYVCDVTEMLRQIQERLPDERTRR